MAGAGLNRYEITLIPWDVLEAKILEPEEHLIQESCGSTFTIYYRERIKIWTFMTTKARTDTWT
jgi:hypothetical protein